MGGVFVVNSCFVGCMIGKINSKVGNVLISSIQWLQIPPNNPFEIWIIYGAYYTIH
jgi:hypothetical protein